MSNTPRLRIFGDTHGKYQNYIKKALEVEFSVHVGDMGFNYDPLKELNSKNHKFLFGNHDAQPDCLRQSHCLGKFGCHTLGGIQFYFISGAWSIDYKFRTPMVDWWPDEELTNRDLEDAYTSYCMIRPDILITHTPPQSIVDEFCDPRFAQACRVTTNECRTRTGLVLEDILRYCPPKKWYFGHLHKSINVIRNGCEMIGINQESYMDVNT